MQDDIREFGMDLGHRVLARDWAGAQALLAPWLRATLGSDDVRRFFEDEYRATLEDNGIGQMRYPEYPDPELGGNQFTNATKAAAVESLATTETAGELVLKGLHRPIATFNVNAVAEAIGASSVELNL